ncbi:hypothetical protein GCM10010313_40470 [Streptomyces violarus]|uniref:Uncharacterized protein n=1 Tax=Streptomyces violarus TaxID=67380 RepID=A0A7W4ZXA8_9ACTN|nr:MULTISPECIES: hypothetical protein [Streptomyces]MBB3080151.1 hypothetical protein [Streptomyces violarus]WRU00602.1 hypothetical protein VJ737_24240 [Streptomyces sp. CGMCC 4.1772]GHD14252.1 hypothetical protein GCM10010313_40470 [Streptomyces violarus]
MQWLTLISTVVGAAIATGSAMLLERQRWRRERADRGVVDASEDAFRRLRDLRDRVMEGALATEPVYLEGRRSYDDALALLRARMREDLRVSDDGTALSDGR